MKLKREFVLAALAPDANMAELCRVHGIDRKAGDKWLDRFRYGGPPPLEDESRRPHTSPFRASGDAGLEVVALCAGPSRSSSIWGSSARQSRCRRDSPTSSSTGKRSGAGARTGRSRASTSRGSGRGGELTQSG